MEQDLMLRTLQKYSLITLLILVCSALLVSSVMAAAPNVVYGTATVDGNPADWNLATDFFKNMYEAGNPDKDLLSKAYLKYDCATQKLFVLVLTEQGVTADNSPDNAWVKVYDLSNDTQVDGGSDSFEWVFNGQTRVGYEASFSLAPAAYNEVEIHLNVAYGDEESRTSSTGKDKQGYTPLTIQCENVPTDDLTVFKYNDRNNDGNQDVGEVGIQGWGIKVFKKGDDPNTATPVASGMTDANGNYTVNLPYGDYLVCEENRAGWTNTDPGMLCQEVSIPGAAFAEIPGGDPVTVNTPSGGRYIIQFLGTSNDGKTWSYRVTEPGGFRSLSHWVLGVCGIPTGHSGPGDYTDEHVNGQADPTTGKKGVKWDTDSNFDGVGGTEDDTGIFTITFDEAYGAKNIEVTFKTGGQGVQFGTGTITGPDCEPREPEPITFGNYELPPSQLVLFKDVDPNTDPGVFDLKLGDVVKLDDAGNGDYTPSPIAIKAGSYTVSEVAGTNTDLSKYTSTTVCYDITANAQIILAALAQGNEASAKQLILGSTQVGNGTTSAQFTVAGGKVIFCLFTNTRKTGDLTVTKLLDINRNGQPNIAGGEKYLGGWTIKVFAQGANPATATPLYTGVTAEGTGKVIFEDIPQGTYLVCEEERSHWTITTGTICREVVVGDNGGETLFANFENRTYIFRKVSTPATNAPVYFDWTLQNLNGAAPGDLTVISDGDATVVLGGPNLFTITELVPDGWDLVKVVCNDQEMTITDNGITFDTRPAETDVDCTFYNEQEKGTITIKKTVVYNADTDTDSDATFVFSGDLPDANGNDAGDFQLQGGGQHNAGSLPIGTYVVTEGAQAGWIPSVECDGDKDNGSTFGNLGDQVSIDLDAGENITCTFTNKRKTGTLTLVKALAQGSTVPNADWQFTISHDGNTLFSPTAAAAGGSTTTYTLPTDGYSVAEVLPAGYDLTKINCGDAGSSVDNPNSPSFDILVLSGQNVTCTFTNESDKGSLKVTKDIIGDATGEFEICIQLIDGAPPFSDCQTFTGDNSTYTWDNLVPGGYGVTEQDPGDDWLPSDPQKVTVVDDETTHVTVTNTFVPPKGGIYIVKDVIDGTNDQDFSFNVYDYAPAFVVLEDFNLDDDGAEGNPLNSSKFIEVEPGRYGVSEAGLPGWVIDIQCTSTDDSRQFPGLSADPNNNGTGIAFDIADDETISCVFINRPVRKITIQKVSGEPGFDANVFFDGALPDVNGGATGIFGINGNGGQQTYENLKPGVYNVTELVPTDWSLASVTCNQVAQTITNNGVNIDVTAGDATCTFTNKYTPRPGYIKVTKDIVGDKTGKFTICVGDVCKEFNGEETKTFEVAPGTYTVSEQDAGANWNEPASQQVTVAPGETKEVTVTNTYVPSKSYIRVTKDIEGDGTGTFTICVNNDCRQFNGEGTQTFEVAAGTHTVSEQDAGANWTEPAAQQVTVAEGETKDVTVKNIYIPPVVCPGLDPYAHLSAIIEPTGNPNEWRARIFNTSDCKYDVGFAAYKKYDNNNANQVLHSSDTRLQIMKGETIITLNAPSCAAQLDVFFDASHLGVYNTYLGKQAQLDQVPLVLPAFATGLYGPYGNWYGPRLLAFKHVWGPFCVDQQPVTRKITIQKVSEPMFDAQVYFDGDLPDVNGGDAGDFDVNGFGGMYTFENLTPGVYNVMELVPNDYALTSVTCNGNPMTINNNTVAIDVTTADATCTFNNTGIFLDEEPVQPLAVQEPVVLDDDQDGVANDVDLCAGTADAEVNADGCGASQLDDDADGVNNAADACPATAAGIAVDAAGCDIPAVEPAAEVPAQEPADAPAENTEEASNNG
jgi:hypothetical protein